MQSNLYVHTKYENIEEIYLYPIWEFFVNITKKYSEILIDPYRKL